MTPEQEVEVALGPPRVCWTEERLSDFLGQPRPAWCDGEMLQTQTRSEPKPP